MPDSPTATIRAFQASLECFLRGEPTDLGRFFTAGATWHLPRSADAFGGRDRCGREAILRMFTEEVPGFYRPETLRFTYHHLTAEDDRVHLHFTLQGVTANGQEYCNEYQTLFRLEAGQIAEAWEYLDTAWLFKLLGAG